MIKRLLSQPSNVCCHLDASKSKMMGYKYKTVACQAEAWRGIWTARLCSPDPSSVGVTLTRLFSPRRMTTLACLIAMIAAFAQPIVAAAHPLGKFTTNHYSRLEIGDTGLRVRYILDLAEIPPFQEISGVIDTDHDGKVSE